MAFAEDNSCKDTITTPDRFTASLEKPEKVRRILISKVEAIAPVPTLTASRRSGRIWKQAYFNSSDRPLSKCLVSDGIRFRPASGTSGAVYSAADAGSARHSTRIIGAMKRIIFQLPAP